MDEELMDDVFYEEAEGASEFGEAEEWEGMDAYAEESDFGDEDAWEAGEEAYLDEFEDEGFEEGFEEGFDEYDEASAFEEGDEAFEDAMAYAMEAEDTDEFFRRIGRAIRRVAPRIVGGLRRAASTVGRVARVAAPIARLIPHPYAQAAATGLNLLGRLRAEGASEEDALEAFAELAAYDESAIPLVAGLAARSVVGRAGARLPVQARRRLVRTMGTAARTLVSRRGPRAVRALPRIVSSVRRTAVARRTPVRAVPRIVSRTVARVTRSRPLARRLSRPAPAAVRRVRTVVRRAPLAGAPLPGASRTFRLRGPVVISIRGA
jgi:hypothetical protein